MMSVISALISVPAAWCTGPEESAADTQSTQDSSTATTPLASWSGGIVTSDQFASWLRFRNLEDDPQTRRAEIENMLMVEVLAAAAVERGVDRDPAIEAALEIAEMDRLAKKLRIFRSKQVTVSDEELKAFLEKYPDTLQRPRKVRLRTITKLYRGEMTANEKAHLRRRMEEISVELQGGADFQEMARTESDSQSRFQGGLIGNVEAGTLLPELDRVAMALEAGELSPVVETETGLTIFLCESIIPGVERSPEEVWEGTRGHLLRRRANRDWEDFQAELLRRAEPSFDLHEARRETGTPEAAVATFRGGEVSRAELDHALRSGPAARRRDNLSDDALRRRLERIVLRELIARSARKSELGLDATGSDALAWTRAQLLASNEMQQLVEGKLEPLTEQEIRAYYDSNAKEFMRPPHHDLALIKIDLESGKALDTLLRAEELRNRLVAGASFAEAARLHSTHPSAAHGGEVGMLTPRQFATLLGGPVQREVLKLGVGEISEVLQHEETLVIVRLNAREERRQLTFGEAAARAEKKLGQERTSSIQSAIERDIKATLRLEL